MADRIALAIIK